jgi:hypothetical protein
MNSYFFPVSNEERENILDKHKHVYNGYRTLNPNPVANEQPLYTQDFANDKEGLVVNNKGEVKAYTNMGINETKKRKPYLADEEMKKGEVDEFFYFDVEDEETKEIESTKRIRIFCDLFLEPNKDSDILLSEIYQEYCIASNWTNNSMLSMSNFIKTLRSLHKYPIKRRSKGMMIIGYHSLVSQQQRMLNEIINNQQERNILQYISPNDMKEIVYQYQEQIFSINQPYVRECFLLLYNTSTPLHAMTFSYFSSIPQLQPFLEKYAVYVERNISKPLRMNPSNDVELFRELSQECMLYFPFHIDLLKQKRKEESAVPKELDVDKNED